MRYIATRPRAEKHGKHGLFGSSPEVSLEDSMKEALRTQGPVWTFIYSLKREDAARLGYDSAENWRRPIMAHQVELAEAMKIPPSQFRWCAAFHGESHHPHIHMMVWSDDPKLGYLTEDGIEKMRSTLTNDIFQDKLLSLYQRKDTSYKEVTEAAHDAIKELIRQMETSLCDSPVIAAKMETLAEMLNGTKGKKVYGDLKKPVKAQVDSIVDELAQLPQVAECYEAWNRLRDEVECYYKDKPRDHLPLSQQKEFRAVKNMVIQEAEHIRLSTVSFKDERMRDEAEEGSDAVFFSPQAMWQMAEEYQDIKAALYSDATEEEKEAAVCTVEQLWNMGFTVAAQGNQYADYRLGKLYLEGVDVPKDAAKAVEHLTVSANRGNQYAQYALGKLYLIIFFCNRKYCIAGEQFIQGHREKP